MPNPSATADTKWEPGETNPDPSVDIPDIYIGNPTLYAQRYHFAAPNRVAYDRYPPVGGPHDPVWAACDGVVYTKPVRNEIMVHSLEHGAVWFAYNPQTLPTTDIATLADLVRSTPYLVMTPYPGLDAPISLQSWGHQLKVDAADDPRISQFVKSLLRNPYLTPEANATCAQPTFDVDNPPAFDGSAPGPGAIQLDYQPPATTS